jgi:hypothetical protein
MLVRFFVLRARLRVRPAPGIPCTLFLSRVMFARPGREIAPRECESAPSTKIVIPGRREAASYDAQLRT